MKTQIEKLIRLAKQYESFGTEYLFPNGRFTCVKKEGFNEVISVYFNNNWTTCEVRIRGFIISLYSGKITIPFDCTEEMIEESYLEACKELDNLINDSENKLREKYEREKQERIEELKKELETLLNK